MNLGQLWLNLLGVNRASPPPTSPPRRLTAGTSELSQPPTSRLWKEMFRVEIVRSRRARRYHLRWLREKNCARLILPRRGSLAAGLRFLEENEAWLRRQRDRSQGEAVPARPWFAGRELFWRGRQVFLREIAATDGRVTLLLESESFGPTSRQSDYRSFLEAALRCQAARELPLRTAQLAELYGIAYTRVVVRAQRRRWGSCSGRGTISLNWRLLQVPPSVCDYVIAHELAHRREMNHSARFWARVGELFPEWRPAEAWLRQHPFSKLAA